MLISCASEAGPASSEAGPASLEAALKGD